METDLELVAATRSGDKPAFAALVTRHRPVVIGLCRRALGDHVLAEDAFQEAVLQAMLGLESLKRPERFGPWLAGIALNVSRAWLRDRSRHAWSCDALAGGHMVSDPVDPEPGPEEVAEATEAAQRVRRAVASLPRGERAAVVAFYLAGLSCRETATALGIAVGAAKTRLYRGRAALRSRLEGLRIEENKEEIMEADLVTMRVADVRRKPADSDRPAACLVVLEEVEGTSCLPIGVGLHEGTALAFSLERVELRRPLTYAFLLASLEAAGARLTEVRIHALVDQTYYAQAEIESASGHRAVDARPSDALNLAVLAGAPIRVSSEVLSAYRQQSAVSPWMSPENLSSYWPDASGQIVAAPDPVTFGWLVAQTDSDSM